MTIPDSSTKVPVSKGRQNDLKVVFGTRVRPRLFSTVKSEQHVWETCVTELCVGKAQRHLSVSLREGRKPERTPELNGHRCPSATHQLLARKSHSSPLLAASGAIIHSFNTILQQIHFYRGHSHKHVE